MAIKPEFKPRQHQTHGTDTALKRDGNIIFSHPVGSGKTFTSISAFERLKDSGHASRALAVTPASLRENYGENGVKKFTDSNYVIYGNQGEVQGDRSGRYVEPSTSNPEYGIVSYEMFRKDPKKYITGHGADTVIFDELHKIKNDESITYKALKDSRPLFRNFIGMTGSITSNTPSDVVPLIDAMTNGNHRLGSKTSFENRFVSKDKNGNKIIVNPILARTLISPYVHNVTEDQIEAGSGVKRPEKVINEIMVPLSGEHEDYYRYAINQLDPITKAKLAMGVGKLGKADLNSLFAKLLKARQVSNSVSAMNPNISLEESAEKSLKVKRLLDDVQSHLKETPDGQVVIHSELLQGGMDVLEAGLKKRGIGYGKFVGKGNAGITEKVRQQDVADYNSGKKKVILLSSAGGEGLDLPNTTLVASLDGHWNPERINQVEARGIRMGGLAHRPEAERKVIVNRYLTKLPVAKLDVVKDTYKLFNPRDLLGRIVDREKVFYNPVRSPQTVDQMMYEIAKKKATGNEQMKDLFDKTAAYSFESDKHIMNRYLDKYQDRLLSGDYLGKYIDEEDENRYIDQLKKYYQTAIKKDIIKVDVKDSAKYENRTPMSNAAITFGRGALTGAIATPLLIPPDVWKFSRGRKFGLGVIAAGSLVGGIMGARSFNKPHVTSAAAEARRKLKLSDEELRDLLRGEAIRKEEIKKTDHFIKVK